MLQTAWLISHQPFQPRRFQPRRSRISGGRLRLARLVMAGDWLAASAGCSRGDKRMNIYVIILVLLLKQSNQCIHELKRYIHLTLF